MRCAACLRFNKRKSIFIWLHLHTAILQSIPEQTNPKYDAAAAASDGFAINDMVDADDVFGSDATHGKIIHSRNGIIKGY